MLYNKQCNIILGSEDNAIEYFNSVIKIIPQLKQITKNKNILIQDTSLELMVSYPLLYFDQIACHISINTCNNYDIKIICDINITNKQCNLKLLNNDDFYSLIYNIPVFDKQLFFVQIRLSRSILTNYKKWSIFIKR